MRVTTLRLSRTLSLSTTSAPMRRARNHATNPAMARSRARRQRRATSAAAATAPTAHSAPNAKTASTNGCRSSGNPLMSWTRLISLSVGCPWWKHSPIRIPTAMTRRNQSLVRRRYGSSDPRPRNRTAAARVTGSASSSRSGSWSGCASTRDTPPTARSTSSGSSTACPTTSQPFFEAIYAVGALWAVGVVVAAALVARRWRLARDLAIAGFVAWFLARLIGALVVDNDSIRESLDVVTRIGDASPSFPVTPVAVVVAVIAAASPFLTRPTRRLGQLLDPAHGGRLALPGYRAPRRRVRGGGARLGRRRRGAPRVRLARWTARRARRSVPRSTSSASPRTMSSSRAGNPGAGP